MGEANIYIGRQDVRSITVGQEVWAAWACFYILTFVSMFQMGRGISTKKVLE